MLSECYIVLPGCYQSNIRVLSGRYQSLSVGIGDVGSNDGH